MASIGLTPGFGPSFLRNAVFAAPQDRPANGAKRRVLVCVFQRGAVDGLSMVVPHGDPAYYQHRSTSGGGIALARTGEDAVLDLDGMFGLHPSLAMLKPIYDKGFLAPIQAVGSPNPTRSHFDAQDFMETAMPGDKSAQDGWLKRVLENCPQDAASRAKSQVRAIAMTPQLPRSLKGDPHALAVGDLSKFGIRNTPVVARGKRAQAAAPAMNAPPMEGTMGTRGATGGFETLYDGALGDVLHGAGQDTFDALKVLGGLNPRGYVPANDARYPNGSYGNSLKQVAQLIKADVGLEIAFAEVGGWDTHAEQGAARGALSRRLQEFGQGLAAFYTDMGDGMADVVVLTMSEFGRTVRTNGRSGTDHGHGTCFLALGGPVKGGRVLGQWPGLAPEQLYENRDLAVTTDFRSVFREVAIGHLRMQDTKTVFPGFAPNPAQNRGIVRA